MQSDTEKWKLALEKAKINVLQSVMSVVQAIFIIVSLLCFSSWWF